MNGEIGKVTSEAVQDFSVLCFAAERFFPRSLNVLLHNCLKSIYTLATCNVKYFSLTQI